MKRVVVTGAPGWLGTSLVHALASGARYPAGETPCYEVRCIVEPGVDPAPLRVEGGKVEWVHADLRSPLGLDAACEGADAVVHAAGVIHPRRVREFFDLNARGTVNLVEAATRAGARRLVYVSSNSPAGLNLSRDEMMREGDPPRPYMKYGLSKLQAEWTVNAAHQAGRIESTILRPCWYYGPDQPRRQTRFFSMIKKGRPIVFGRGENLRSMCYIDNCVQGILLAIGSDVASGKTYWITDRRPYPFIEIIRTVADLLGVKVRPRYLPAIASEMARMVDSVIQATGFYNQEFHVAGELAADIAVSIEAAQKDLGYDPEIELEEGMRRSIDWLRKRGEAI